MPLLWLFDKARPMSYYAIWPVFVCMTLIMVLAATSLFSAADAPPSPRPNRLRTLDGLRGFLALAVYFYHSAIYHHFLQPGGGWGYLPSRPYSLFGPTGVGFFFMITGYLFWSRLLAERGRPNWVRLYIGRLFRIGPVYLVAIGSMIIFVMIATGMHLNLPPYEVADEIGRWLSLGFLVGPDINTYGNTALVLAGVTWTLHCEWLFYLSLPLLALAARYKWLHLPLVATALVTSFYLNRYLPMYLMVKVIPVCMMTALFLTGMLCASLHRAGIVLRLPDKLASALVVALITYIFAHYPTAYAVDPIILMGLAFYLIVSGCSVFGLLTSRPARRLGDISYGIYIMQGLALDLVLRPAPLRAIALASPVGHWALVLLGAVFLVGIATLVHALVERPGIAFGKRVAGVAARAAMLHRVPKRTVRSALGEID